MSSAAKYLATIEGTGKAWGHFDGASVATPDATYNIASITDGGVGIFQPQIGNDMADTSYTTLTDASRTINGVSSSGVSAGPTAVGSFEMRTASNGSVADCNQTVFVVHGGLA